VAAADRSDVAPREAAAVRGPRPFGLFPAAGRKGGERVRAQDRVERVGPDDERERPREARAEPE
ncbi:MAG: hypothetical protein M3O91_06080, partial [Chloroflexota bacterium]|nr:hypothetical protein [Chloroflexota bacterium]